VAAHDALGQGLTPHRQRDEALVDADEALRLHAADHLRDGRAGDADPLGDAGLDDAHVVFAELEDRFAVLLEGRVELTGLHGGESRADAGRFRRLAPRCSGLAGRGPR
jgi:hypothetical protein